MPRNRAVGLVIHENQLLGMFRKNTREYFVFPGGGIEAGETPEQATVREIREETSLEIEVGKLTYELQYDNGDVHYYFLSRYLSGTPHMHPNSPEYQDNLIGDDLYLPQWLPVEKLSEIILYPLEVRDRLIQDLQHGFSEKVVTFQLETPKKA